MNITRRQILINVRPQLFRESMQLRRWNSELRDATVQADHKLWKHPNERLGQAVETGEMNGELSVELALVFRLARLASHFSATFLTLSTNRVLSRLPRWVSRGNRYSNRFAPRYGQ